MSQDVDLTALQESLLRLQRRASVFVAAGEELLAATGACLREVDEQARLARDARRARLELELDLARTQARVDELDAEMIDLYGRLMSAQDEGQRTDRSSIA
jgi:uncharacterized protein YlxW (UPF0749 family)